MIIVGAGGHAMEVYSELVSASTKVTAFYDELLEENTQLFGIPVLREMESSNEQTFAIAVGKPHLRKKLFMQFTSQGWKAVNVISMDASVSVLEVKLGTGLNLMHGVYIGPRVVIGDGTLINAKSSVHHGTRIGNFCEICIGVSVAGACIIEDEVFIGMGAQILPGIRIGKGAIVGAGAVVIKDVPAGVTVKGVPAK